MTDNELRDKMKDLPDLPGLETVEPRDNSMLPIFIYVGGMMALVGSTAGMTIYYYGKYLDKRGMAMTALCAALVAWVVFRIVSGYHRFRTDANGLTMIGVLRRRFVPWIDVEEACIRTTRAGTAFLILKTKRDTVKIDPGGTSGSSAARYGLMASACQHLRRLGRADGMVLPPQSLSFWEPVPDDVPSEIDWSGKGAAAVKVTVGVGVLMFGGMIVAIWLAFPLRFPAVMYPITLSAAMLSVLKWMMLPDSLQKAWRVTVREGYFEAQLPFSKAYVPWSEVRSARFLQTNLIINYGSRNSEVRVFYAPGKRESEDLILAIIRRLRASSGLAIAMPETYSRNRAALYKPAYSSEANQRKARAFLNTLDPLVRKRISKLYGAQIVSIFLGLAAGMAAMFTSPLERLARNMHQTPDTVFLFTGVDMWVFLPVIVIIAGGGALICNRIGTRMPSPYREAWLELNKVQSQGKLGTVLGATVIVLTAASLLVCIPAADSYTRVTDRGITTNGFWTLGHEDFHPWSQVRHVISRTSYNVDHGRTVSSITYEVIFADGKQWEAQRGNLGLLGAHDLGRAALFIAERSGRQMEYP